MDNNKQTIVRVKRTIGFKPDCAHLIYVEKSYDAAANNLLIRYLTKDERLLFLPRIARKIIQEQEVVDYANPSHIKLDFSKIYDTVLDYVEDRELMACGFLHYTGIETVDWYHFSYTPYENQNEEELGLLFDYIIDRDCEDERLAVDDGPDVLFKMEIPDKLPADTTFSWESQKLIKEIEEKVIMLEQTGISRAVLFKMLGDDIKLSRMIIDSKYRIYLIDYDYMEIKMTPLVKAVYLLFLNHPEGILFKNLEEYKIDLMWIYGHLTNRSEVQATKQSINDICNPLNNSINEKCARIREAFVSRFDPSIAEYYCVTGKRGEPKGIKLDRSMVIGGKLFKDEDV